MTHVKWKGKVCNLGALGSFYYVWTCMFILYLKDFNLFLPKTNVYKNKTSLPSKSMIMGPIPSNQPFHNT